MKLSANSIRRFLDVAMIVLIFIASFILIFEDTEHFYTILFIMLVFLLYFVNCRYAVYFGKKPKKGREIRELPGRQPNLSAERKNRFTQQYEQRSIQKSKRDVIQKRNEDSMNNSTLSYMNRSRKANESLSRSYISSGTGQVSDFDFLTNRESGSNLMRESFASRRGIEDSYIRNVTSHQQREEDISKQVRKNMSQCTNRYIKTLQKLKQTPYSAQTTIKKIRQLCLVLCKQYYKQNIENLKSFIQILTQIYDIRIYCKEIAELEALLRMIPFNKEQKLQISLPEILRKIAKAKNDKFENIGVPIRSKNKQLMGTSFRTNCSDQRLVRQVQQSALIISQQNKNKLKKLQSERQKLSSYFYNNNITYLTPQTLMTNIQTLKQYIQQQQSQESQYELVNNIKISEEYSERLLIGFNISKNKLNQLLVNIPQYQLEYKKKSYLGWLKLSHPNFYQIKQTLNSDNGHPHYDLLYGKQNKQQYGCQYGKNNGYCLLWVYLLLMQGKNVQIIRGNKKLQQIYSKYLGIIVL